MRMRWIGSWTAVLCASAMSCFRAADAPPIELDAQPRLTPNTVHAIAASPAIRALWARIVHPVDRDDWWGAFRELARLSAAGSDIDVIQQAISLATEDPEAMYVLHLGFYIPRLGISPGAVLQAAVPIIESAHEGQREQAEALIRLFFSEEGVWIRDDDVRDYLRNTHPQPPERFVEVLYSIAPARTLLLLDAAYAERERHWTIIWAEHLISDAIWRHENGFADRPDADAAKTQLEVLSRRPEWWVQLYVREIERSNSWLLVNR